MSFLTTPLADLPGLGTKRAQLIAEELDTHLSGSALLHPLPLRRSSGYLPYRLAYALDVGGAGRGDFTAL